jgi:hypothetical protein
VICPHCEEEAGPYLDSHIKRRHSKELAAQFQANRPVPHFTGQVRKEHFVLCSICGWEMDKAKLEKHQSYRHPQIGARNSRSTSGARPLLESPPPGPDAPIKAATNHESLKAHSGWKQATTAQSRDVTG